LLLVPHHGSKTSSSAAFLDAVQPQWAMAQAGYRNRFGHPAEAVAARYEERGIRLVKSAPCGAALWHSQHPDALAASGKRANATGIMCLALKIGGARGALLAHNLLSYVKTMPCAKLAGDQANEPTDV
jgi:hypothetical protein